MQKQLLGALVALGVLTSVSMPAIAVYLPGAQQAGVSVGTEWFFNQQDLAQPKSQAQCSEFWGQESYYLNGDLDSDGIPDMGRQWYFKDNFRYSSAGATRGVALIVPRFNQYIGTTVSYFAPTSNMLNLYQAGTQYSLSSQKAFYRFSKVAPLNQAVRAIESEPFLIEAPQTRSSNDANFQIVFDISFAPFSSWGTTTSDYFVATVPALNDYNPVPNSNKRWMKNGITNPDGPLWSSDYLNQTALSQSRSINWTAEMQHGSECVNVKVSWCGDGIVNNTSFSNGVTASEQCDLGTQNGQPGAACTAQCTIPPVELDPDVSIVKSVVGTASGYQANDIVTFRLLYRNIGQGMARNVVIRDELPAGLTFVSATSNPGIGSPTVNGQIITWPTLATLAQGAQGEIIIQARVSQYNACAAYTNNGVIAASNEPVNLNYNNSSSASIYSSCGDPDVVTSKSVSAIDGSYLPGNTVEYTLTYQNVGVRAANGVVVTDTLPGFVNYVVNSSVSNPNIGQPNINGQTLTWNIGTLQPGQSGTIKIRVTIKSTTPTCSSLIVRNDFTISATNEPASLLGNNPSYATFPMQCVDLFSRKTVDKATIGSGEILTYTITYGNAGDVAMPATVTDTLPAGLAYVFNSSNSNPNVGQPIVNGQTLTWNVGILPGGSSRTITIQAIAVGDTSGKTFVNKVCIVDDNDYNNNNCGTAVTTGKYVTPNIIDLWSKKTVNRATVQSGDEVTYTITYGNSGNITAPGTVVDTLPAGMRYVGGSSTSTPDVGQPTVNGQNITWNVGNLPAGSSRTITFRARVIQATPNQQYVNLVCISDDNNFGNNNCGTATSTTDGGGGNNIDLWSKKKIDKTGVVLNDIVTYTITYGNSGTVAAPATVTDTLPAGVTFVAGSATSNPDVGQPAVGGPAGGPTQLVWDVGTLPAGSTRTITFQARITQISDDGQYVNLVCISDDNNFGNNNCGTAVTCIITPNTIDLWSKKIVDKAVVQSGDIVTYTVTYGNSGSTSSPATVVDTLPADMQYVGGSSTSTPDVGQPVVNGQTLTWDVGTLPAGSSRTIRFQARVIRAVPNQQYINTVCISDDNNFGNNNCGTAKSTTPGDKQFYDLSIDKTPKVQIAYSGQNVTFALTVRNAGPANATNFSVKDYLPEGLEFVSATTPNTYDPATRTITWDSLSLNASGSLSLIVTAKYVAAGTVTNYTEICSYNGVNSGLNPRDIDSTPCNGTGNNEDDTSSAKVTQGFLDLNLNKYVNGEKEVDVFSGEVVDFSLVVGNSGSVAASNFTVNDYLPQGFVYVQGSAGSSYDAANRTITWSGLTLSPGASTVLTFKAYYIDAVERTNYAEVCTYNGLNGTGVGPKDIDSDPCNRGAKPPVEDDESSALVRPRSASNILDVSINKLIDGVKVKTNASSGGVYPISLVVTNSGGVGISNFSVRDYMPVGLEFVAGSANPANVSYDAVSRIVLFTGLSIAPNQTITLTFNAAYRSASNLVNFTEICDYRGTNASGSNAKDIDSNPCNRGATTPIEDDESSAQIGPGGGGGGGPTVDVTLNKLVNNVKEYQANSNETVTFTLRATNEGNTTIRNVSIVDYMPANVEYVSGSASTGAGVTVSYDPASRKIVWSGLTFTNNSAFDLTFRAVYNGTEARTNFAEICAYNGRTNNLSGQPTSINNPVETDSDPCNRGANPPVEDDESQAVIRPRTGGCTTPGGCGGGGRNYCGDGVIARPNSYGQYEECDEGTNNGKAGYNCSTTCKTGRGTNPVCGNGTLEVGEVCDQGANGGVIPAGRPYAGKTCSNKCNIPGVTTPACEYIDPPSIQSNEYLPYRWDLENIQGVRSSCTAAGDIVRSSMLCTFTVTDAKGNTVDQYDLPCFDRTPDVLTKSAYTQVVKSLGYDPDDSRLIPYGYDSRRFNFGNTLGEHKISLVIKEYDQCESDGNGGFTPIKFTSVNRRVCEMNFAVTKPYMVSRGPLGNFVSDPAGLTEFFYMPDGLAIFTSPVPRITQKFDVTTEVKDSVKKLVDEYRKVAVKATSLPEFGTVMKVPGKEIYFFEGDRDESYITISDRNAKALSDKPFTIIVTRGQLVVKGNLANAGNGMYINASERGIIKFAMDDKEGVNGVKGCDVTQSINGIFISVNSVESLDHKGLPKTVANIDQSQEWCNAGDLTVRGVLIGNGITENVVARRRSSVNSWFRELTSINADRKEYLLNHGALVLKYNPELFDNLPPGAEILAQVLNTYKK